MFRYGNQLKVYSIGNAKVGGQPGQYATALAGTIFYAKDKIVSDPAKGVFDREAAEKRIRMQEEMSDTTGNPCWVQLYADSAAAMQQYLEQ